MEAVHPPPTTTGIWNRLLRPDHGDMPLEVAQYFLQLTYDQKDLDRMHELAVKNQEGILTPQEQAELQNYRQVGLEFDLLRAKAWLSLKRLENGG